ncbi:hypothetical protein D3C80_1123170 [compost metagenome]
MQIDIYRPSQCVCNNKRRRCQIVGFNLRMHTTFEVTVTGQHSRNSHVVIGNSCSYFIWERTGVTDASSTAVTGYMESKRFQRLDETGFMQIFSYDERAWSQAALHISRLLQPAFNRLFRKQAGT